MRNFKASIIALRIGMTHTPRLLVKCLVALMVLGLLGTHAVQAQTFPTPRPTWFHFNQDYIDNEISGHLVDSWYTGYELWPPLTTNTKSVVAAGPKDLVLLYPAAGGPNSPASRYASVHPQINPAVSAIQAEQTEMATLTAQAGNGRRVWWNTMIEWDGLDGHSLKQAEVGFAGDSRAQNYARLRNLVTTTWTPLGTMLDTAQATRGYLMTAVTDYVSNVHYGYEWGLDMQMMERAIDEVGDIVTGVAYMRGAAAQYNKPWGIDQSTWRTGANSVTSYNQSTGQQTGGFSVGYHKRHTYYAYMAGANKILYESHAFRYGNGALDPFGLMSKAFGAFAVAHPNRGTAVVPIAFMLDHDHGHVPPHWLIGGAVWYGFIGYSPGDRMVDNLFDVLYPGYRNHGLSLPGFSWNAGEAFHQYMLAGNDPRPYEPMPNSTYGDLFDVLLSNATIEALNRYQVVMPVGNFVMTPALNTLLTTYATAGGVVVLNSTQVSTSDQTLLGVTLGSTTTATASKWGAESNQSESSFTYRIVTPTTATVIATNPANGQPLITMRTVGSGKVYFVAANYMQNDAQTALLLLSRRLFSDLTTTYRKAWVTGAPVDFLTTQGVGFTTVTLLNNSGSTWSGIVSMNITDVTNATEWLTGATLSPATAGGVTTVSVSVPAWDVRVFALTSNNRGVDVTAPALPVGLRIQ